MGNNRTSFAKSGKGPKGGSCKPVLLSEPRSVVGMDGGLRSIVTASFVTG